jgi:hypothetical protein
VFNRLFKRKPTGPAPIHLELTVQRREQDGVFMSWSAQNCPEDALFDMDFRGYPSNVVTGFVWDASQDELQNVFCVADDTSFRVQIAYVYSGAAQDGSANVERAWISDDTESAFALEKGQTAAVTLHFAPEQKQVRAV